jgi:hypothetical protein
MALFSDNNGARADCRRPSTSAGVADPLGMVGMVGISPNHFCQFVFIALFCVRFFIMYVGLERKTLL